jgi:hypothetical protein
MMDWTALGEETIDLLRRYLAIDTTYSEMLRAVAAA